MEKLCTKCGTVKDLKESYKQKNTKDGLKTQCKSCIIAYGKLWQETHKEQVNKKTARWRRDNREKHNSASKSWRKRFPEKQLTSSAAWRSNHRSYHKDRRKVDLSYKLSCYLRYRLRSSIKQNLKSGSFVRDLGCSIPEFKVYLEKQFKPGMSWDNWSANGWHIDHIIPLSKFNLSDRSEFLKASHYTNMQPLWAVDNLRKGNK